ncbi:MAG: serine/threonine protein kinase, partial [Planctomycetes bacterium]|nr:serine/threonine protein kinase [Planctomycetota bacterium]
MSTAGPEDAGSHDSTGDPVRDWLDAFSQRQLPFETVRERIIELCARDAEASWSALSRLDQYHRRGIIDRDAYFDLKQRIVHVAMPGHSRASASRPALASPADGVADATVVPSRPIEAPATVAGAAPRIAPGVVLLGRYEIETEIGRGERTTVFRARDRERSGVDGVSDLVAIKTLRDDVEGRADALEALRRECFRTQILTHANIVNVFDWDRDGEASFVTMEFVAGESLQHVLGNLAPRRLRRDHALAIIAAIGDALACAHASGIVHGELDPGNVMIGSDGRVCVLGFGGVRPDPREPSFQLDGPRATRSRYASPQVLGGAHAVPGDDLFSLGCIACDLLADAARLPEGTDARAPRRRPRPRKPRGMHRRDWPLVRRALAPERDARPESVAQWVAELTRGGDRRRPQGERRTPPLEELVDRARRPPRFRLVHALVAATVLVAGIG